MASQDAIEELLAQATLPPAKREFLSKELHLLLESATQDAYERGVDVGRGWEFRARAQSQYAD